MRPSAAVRLIGFAVVVASSTLLGACSVLGRQPKGAPPADSLAAIEWPSVERDAMNFIVVRDYAHADSTLRAFAARYPGTPATAQSVFLRGLARIDPSSWGNAPLESIRAARNAFDAYVSGGAAEPHYVESLVMRRVAGRLDTLQTSDMAARATATTTSAIPGTLRDTLKVRDDEIARLRTELESTKAELDRVRRRLAPPKP